MKITLAQSRKISVIYGFVVLFANIMAVAVSSSLNFPSAGTETDTIWLSYLNDNETFTNAILWCSFLVPCILCSIYSIPIIKTNANENLISKRIINAPLVFSILGISGWVTSFIVQTALVVYLSVTQGLKPSSVLFSSGLYTSLEAIFSFILSYFTLETVNRAYVLPKIFPDGNISKIKGIIKPSVTVSFMLYFVTVSVFPVTVLLGAYIAIQRYMNVPLEKTVIIMSLLLLFMNFAITIIFSRMFSKPIHALMKGASNISKGIYSEKVPIVSNDEMGIFSDVFNDMSASLTEKEFMRDTFGKVVDPEVRDYLLQGNISLGGEIHQATVLFSDIRGFTSLSENMPPDKVVAMLNKYFDVMGQCVTKNNGIINKYIGDAIMAIFGVPVENPNHARDAYNAALEMRTTLIELNEQFKKEGYPQLHFGIGIHSGEVLAGNIGASNRMEYTVIGDTVNSASRLESLCKEYDCDLIVSESTLNGMKKEMIVSESTLNSMKKELAVSDEFHCSSSSVSFPSSHELNQKSPTYLADVQIRGRQQQMKIYRG